jgi:histone H3/H4
LTKKITFSAVALREIRKMQKVYLKPIIPAAPFQRLVREIADTLRNASVIDELRWGKSALLCLQEAAEAYMTSLFEGLCNLYIYIFKRILINNFFRLQPLRYPRQARHHPIKRHETGASASWGPWIRRL